MAGAERLTLGEKVVGFERTGFGRRVDDFADAVAILPGESGGKRRAPIDGGRWPRPDNGKCDGTNGDNGKCSPEGNPREDWHRRLHPLGTVSSRSLS
jgi:hypothetical protein